MPLLLLGCGTPPEPPADPQDDDAKATPKETHKETKEEIAIHKRFVRVHLKSFGDWKKLEITGKGGVHVGRQKMERFVLKRSEPRFLNIRGDRGILTVGGKTYAGDLLWRHGHLINNVSLENYVLGVLRGEIPLRNIPVSAAGAQAIAVRSYTLHYVAQHHAFRDLDDTTQFQVYAGLKYAPDDDNLRAGVRATAGTWLEYGGKPLKAYYHSTCGGHTTDVPTGLNRAPTPPMSGVPCDFCRISKYWRWTSTLKKPFTIVERGPGGRARTIRSQGLVMNANAFRLTVGPSLLRSTLILKIEGSTVSGAGWGHGVGMCQMGAIGRARIDGKKWSAERIVKYYYPGATLRRAP